MAYLEPEQDRPARPRPATQPAYSSYAPPPVAEPTQTQQPQPPTQTQQTPTAPAPTSTYRPPTTSYQRPPTTSYQNPYGGYQSPYGSGGYQNPYGVGGGTGGYQSPYNPYQNDWSYERPPGYQGPGYQTPQPGQSPYGYQPPQGGYNQGGYQGDGYYPQQPQGGYGYDPHNQSPYQPPQPPQGGTMPYQAPFQMNSDFSYNTGGVTNTQLGQYTGKLEGFEASKLNDPTKTSAKYMFGRIASKYEPTQQGFAQLINDPEFQKLGMQSLGNGKIKLPNGDVIDVVRGFQSGGMAWQWGAETENGAPTGFSGPAAQAQAPVQPQMTYPDPTMGGYFGYGGYPPGMGYGYTPTNQPVMDPYAFWAQQMAQYQLPPQAPTAPTPSGPAYTDPYAGWMPAPSQVQYGTMPMSFAPSSYGQGVMTSAGTYSPAAQTVQSLAQGMYPDSMFGDYYGF